MARRIRYNEFSALVGQELGVSSWVHVDQDRINRFADVTDDHQWIHVDVERAIREQGHTIAHGLLILGLIPSMSEQITEVLDIACGLNYGFDRIRFTRPVPSGATIRLHEKLEACAAKSGGLLLRKQCRVEMASEELVLLADWLTLLLPPA